MFIDFYMMISVFYEIVDRRDKQPFGKEYDYKFQDIMECEFYDIEFRNLKFINCNNPIQNSYGEYYTSEELENVKMCYADIILGVIHNYVC